jgi:hypothetical protein
LALLSGTQSDLIREAFDNLLADSGTGELVAFRFVADDRGEGPRNGAARALHVNGLVVYMGGTSPLNLYMPTGQVIDEALRLGVITIADVTALDMARKRANLRAQGGA